MTISGRDAVLRAIRDGLTDVPRAETAGDVPVPRDYRTADPAPRPEILDRFAERVADYRAEVHRVSARQLRTALRNACRAHGAARLVVPPGVPASWRPDGVELLVDEPGAPLTVPALDAVDGVLTGCAAGIAETGTIVLDGGERQGRRALTLVPDLHLCVVRAAQVVGSVPEAIQRLGPVAARPLTFVSGPSATSDIELSRVEGVHGPRRLVVFLVP